jgi:uncharacterized cupin superfamily protein
VSPDLQAAVNGIGLDDEELGAGSMFILLDGWRGEWEVHQTVRKVYAIWPTR